MSNWEDQYEVRKYYCSEPRTRGVVSRRLEGEKKWYDYALSYAHDSDIKAAYEEYKRNCNGQDEY